MTSEKVNSKESLATKNGSSAHIGKALGSSEDSCTTTNRLIIYFN